MKLKVKHSTVNGNIHIFRYNTVYGVASAFIRMQEYFESGIKEIRYKVLRLDQIQNMYAAHHNGKFKYYSDWTGFNIKGEIFDKWYQHYYSEMGRFTDSENFIISKLPKYGTDFTIIGYVKGDKETKNHELAHAMYATIPEYRAACDSLATDDNLKIVKRGLLKLGYGVQKDNPYSEYMVPDELQAYFGTTTTKGYLKEHFPIKDLKKTRNKYRKIFKEFSGRLEVSTR